MAAVGALDEEERQQVLYGSTMMSSLIVPVDPIEVDNGYMTKSTGERICRSHPTELI